MRPIGDRQSLGQNTAPVLRLLSRNIRGFTLTELIIVIFIMGILFGIVTINYGNWQKKSQVERQTRELFTDINTARTESVFRKTRHRITFQPNSYVFARYSSENEAWNAGTTISNRNVPYQLTRETGASIADAAVEFDVRGLVTGANFSSPNLTLNLNPVNSGAMFDCIVIHVARTNMGKMENGTCTFK